MDDPSKQVEFFLQVPMLPQVCATDCLRQKEVDRPLRREFHRVSVLPNKPKIKIPFVKEFYSSLNQYISHVSMLPNTLYILTQWFVMSPPTTAGPNDLAGFILDPVKGT